jgi:hypothetical protein
MVSAARTDGPDLETLNRVWPPERQILLLTAALGAPGPAQAAWRRWNQLCTLDEATSPEVRLLASVARRMPELDPGSPLMSRLIGARRYIFTRTQLTLAAARPLLAALTDAGLRLLLIKGAARIAEDPKLAAERTLRDVDVLVHPEDLGAAFAIVERAGWMPRLPNWWAVDGSLEERVQSFHATGFNTPDPKASGVVDIHHFTLPMCRNVGDDGAFWTRARKATFLEMPFLVPSPTDSILIALAHALLFSSGQKTADWALDIEPPIRAGSVDWSIFLQEAHARKIEAFLLAPLILAARRIGIAMPAAVIAELALAIDKTFLEEFESLTTRPASSTSSVRLTNAIRGAAGRRAVYAANRERIDKSDTQARHVAMPRIAVPASLAPKADIRFGLPNLTDAESQLTLEVRFRIRSSSLSPKIVIACPGLVLKVWRPPPDWSPAQHRRRHRLVLQVPAALFIMRRITQLCVRAGAKTEIASLSIRWRDPASLTERVARLLARLKRRMLAIRL